MDALRKEIIRESVNKYKSKFRKKQSDKHILIRVGSQFQVFNDRDVEKIKNGIIDYLSNLDIHAETLLIECE